MAGIAHKTVGTQMTQAEFEAADSHDLSGVIASDMAVFEPAIANGTANYIRGMNAAANAKEWKQLAGTTNRVTVTHAANLITLNGPQDLHTGASPTFAGLFTTTNVGIGTSNPIANANQTSLTINGTNYSRLDFKKGDTAAAVLYCNDTNLQIEKLGAYPITFSTNSFNRMTIEGGGNVVIGSATGSAQLHTTGTVRFQNFGAGTATFDASGNVSSVSDERFKDVRAMFLHGLPEIMRITPIVYRWNKESGMETEHEYAGFSAQDVERAIPLAIGRNPEGYLSLQDRALMAAMVNAIKELKLEIDQLKGVN